MTSVETHPTQTDLREIADAIRSHERFLVATHENPDGDALGSILAMKDALEQLGKDAVMYLYGSTPLPTEYGFMPLGDLRRELPADAGERVVIALDCANERRLGPDRGVLDAAPLVIDIDHHHDNTRFGDLNLVLAEASSTGEILAGLFAELGVRLTPEIAEALYIALVTDTGRFQYTNTSPKTLRLAADLVEAGANVHRVFQEVYETVAFAKLKLLARALERAQVLEGGRLIVSVLLRSDFDAVGAEEPFSEGIIDHLRAVEGADMVALIREPPTQNGPTRRVSLRTTAEDIDVSAIARKSAGGGHRQAAGFSSERPIAEIVEFIRREYLAQADGIRPRA
jgi:phosphoesterase RecJ-like protein